MYQLNDVVVYRRNVCRVIGNTKSKQNGEDCYLLVPYYSSDHSTRMIVPVSNKGGHLRPLVSREEVHRLLDQMDTMECLENKPANMKSQYASLLKGDAIEDLICIIKTSFLRNKERERTHKKLASIDGEYLEKAEKYLFSEISVSLNISYEDTKNYFSEKMNQIAERELI